MGGGGGGGVLNKMIPGYKDLVWNRLPIQLRKLLIARQHKHFESNLYKESIVEASRIQQFDSAVAAQLAPDYVSRTPAVDYKRQFARGTLIEGRDVYLPTPEDQTRLENLNQPYSADEEKTREKFSRYDLKFALGILFGGFCYWDYKQSRPLAWCMIFDPAKPRQPWYHRAFTHSHDVKSVRRGFEVFRGVCSSCHSLKRCKWWYLMKDVYPVRRVQEFAAEKTMVDGLTNEGEMNIRPCMTWDYFPRPFPTEEAGKEANNGKLPPDFSQGPYFYRGGADYFFALLTGYRDPPVGVTLTEGTYYNPWFSGGVIGMPPPLEDGLVDFEDGTPATVSQMAKDVVSFLVFVADPCHTERAQCATKVLFGAFLAFPCFYYLKRFAVAGAINRRVDFDRIRMF